MEFEQMQQIRMHEVNVPLLRKTLEWATAHPEEHDQSVWVKRTACGTAGCIAGKVVLDLGYEIAWDDWPVPGRAVSVLLPEGGNAPISDVAAEALGLDEDQRYYLFHEDNSLTALWILASDFTQGEIEIPEQFA